MTTTVRPRTPLELAVLLPYQLGYHPGPSVVLVVMHGRRLGMLQRHDLPDEPACGDVARHAVEVALRERATSLILMGFEEEAGAAAPLLEAMVLAAEDAGIEVGDRLVVRDGHAHSRHRGRPVVRRLPRPRDVPAVAAFVHAGVCPLPTREHLVLGVLPPRDEERAHRVGGADVSSLSDDAALALTWARALDPGADAVPVTQLGDDELLVLAASLGAVGWRDALLAVLCPGTLPVDSLDSHQVDLARVAAQRCPWVSPDGLADIAAHHDELMVVRARLGELTSIVPTELTPSLLTCVALLAWWGGDGTVAGACLERALDVDPTHALAGLMLQLLSAGLRPWAASEQARAPGSAA